MKVLTVRKEKAAGRVHEQNEAMEDTTANYPQYVDTSTIQGDHSKNYFDAINYVFWFLSMLDMGVYYTALCWTNHHFFQGKQTLDAQRLAALIYCADRSSLILQMPQQCCLFLNVKCL